MGHCITARLRREVTPLDPYLDAGSHFPVVEVPDAVAGHMKRFVGR